MSIYQVTVKQRLLNQEVRNIFYYETTVGEPSDSEWVDIADEIRADLDTYWKTGSPPEWEYYAIEARRVDTAGLLSREFVPTSGTLVGTSVDNALPTQIALLVSVKGTTTKPNRARSYLAGRVESVVVDSIFTVASANNAENYIDDMSVLNGAGTNPLQRVAAQWNSTHTVVTVTNNIAGNASVASRVPATQRRRRIGVGI